MSSPRIAPPCSLRRCLAVSLVLLSAGCAIVDTVQKIEPTLRTEPSYSVSLVELCTPAPTDRLCVPIGEAGSPIASIEFINDRREVITTANLSEQSGKAIYATVVLNQLIKQPNLAKPHRDDLARIVLLVSDYNANVWLSRVFSNKAAAETAKGLLHDLTVGAGAATAGTDHVLSAILSTSSFFWDKTIDNLDKTYFASASFQTMESAIQSKRKELSDAIREKLRAKSADEYPIYDVLNDVQALDEVCSIKGGLRELQLRAAGQNIAAPTAPSIGTQPVAPKQALLAGQTFTLTVTADGTPPLKYQWTANGAPIDGATSASLSLSHVQVADSGINYAVVVSNKQGQAVSNPVKFEVLPAALALRSDHPNLKAGEKLTLTAVSSETWPADTKYTWFKDGKDVTAETAAGSTPGTFTKTEAHAPDAGTYWVMAEDKTGRREGSAKQSVSVLEITAQPKDTSIFHGSDGAISVEATGAIPLAIQWYHNGIAVQGERGHQAELSFTAATPDDAGMYYATVKDASGAELSTRVAAITVPPRIVDQPAATSVIDGSAATFKVRAEGDGSLSYQWYRGAQALAGQTGDQLDISPAHPADAADYHVDVTDATKLTTSSHSAALQVFVPPRITKQPANTTVATGQPVALRVQATGDTPLAYQWKHDGSNLANATSASLTIAKAGSADAGSYVVEVTDANGQTTTSAEAKLEVTPPKPQP